MMNYKGYCDSHRSVERQAAVSKGLEKVVRRQIICLMA